MNENDVNNGLNQMLEILEKISREINYEQSIEIINNLTLEIKNILFDFNYANDNRLNNIEQQLNYLTEIYNEEEVYDLVNLYASIQYYLTKLNKKKYVESLREQNRKKEEEKDNNAKY